MYFINYILREAGNFTPCKLAFLASTKLLENMNKVIFQKKYFNLFSIMQVTRNTKIIEEGETPNYIYIIKDGEFEIYTRKSTFQLNKTIENLGGEVSNMVDVYDTEGKPALNLDDPKYKKFMHEKKALKICIVKEREVIGLEDLVCQDTYGFSVECTSSEGEVFKITTQVYNLVII
jgi:CRP-like cAMP-binding protein